MLANITTMTVFIVVINALISSSNLVDEEQAGGLFFSLAWVGTAWRLGLGTLGQCLGNLA